MQGRGARLGSVMQGQALLEMRASWQKVAQEEQGQSQDGVRFQRHGGVLCLLGHEQTLLPEPVGRLQLGTHQIKTPQANQHWEVLRGRRTPLAQDARPIKDLAHFRGRIASGSTHGSAQRQT